MTTTAAALDRLVPDPQTIRRFLRESVCGDIHLAWITPDGGRAACAGRWFGDDVDAATAWAASHNANGQNLYWTVNVVRSGLHKKPGKADITHAQFVHVDIDPPKDGSPFDRQALLAKLEQLNPAFVIDSGGGLQAFWRLDNRCENLPPIEDINQRVRALFRADACQNIDRLMRIPGTINWPDKRKRSRGRVPAKATVLHPDTGEAVQAERLSAIFAAAPSKQDESAAAGTSVLDELGITMLCQPLHRLLTATDPKRRSEEVVHAAGEMVRRGFDDGTIARVLLDPTLTISGHCLDQPDPSRSAQRAIKKVRQEICRDGSGSVSGRGHVDQTAEPVPVDLWARYEPTRLPVRLLPTTIEQFAFQQGELMGVDPGGLAMAALAVCAAAIPDRIEVQVKEHDPHWRESARLWVALIGPPSSRKSPIMAVTTRPLNRIDGQLFAAFASANATYETLPTKERKEAPRPKQRRLRISDATIEAAQEVLKDSPDGVLSVQDELSGWFGAMDKYAAGKGAMADRGFWLQAYNGGQYAVNRVQRGAVLIPNLSISVLGGIQPGPLRRIVNEAVDDGLIQRLIPVPLGPASVGIDAPRCATVSDYEDLVEHLWQLQGPGRGIPSLAPTGMDPPLRFTPEAQVIRRELEQRHFKMMQTEIISPKMASHFGKYDGLFARLCLVWHCIEHATRPDLPREVSKRTARRVAEFLHTYIQPNAVAFYVGMLGLADDHETLVELASYILSRHLERVQVRDLQRATKSLRSLTADQSRRLCEKLESLGWLQPIDAPPNSRTAHWGVNPLAHRMFEERGREESDRREKAREVIRNVFAG